MRNLSEVSIHNRVLVWYFIILVAIAGIFSYMKLGRMEDPTYTVMDHGRFRRLARCHGGTDAGTGDG